MRLFFVLIVVLIVVVVVVVIGAVAAFDAIERGFARLLVAQFALLFAFEHLLALAELLFVEHLVEHISRKVVDVTVLFIHSSTTTRTTNKTKNRQ